MKVTNIFQGLDFDEAHEHIETLLSNETVRIEKIITSGQKSADGFWYDQEDDEFVIVLQGSATVAFEDENVRLNKGDSLLINAHKKHRVSWSDPNEVTLWLAVFMKNQK